MSPVLKLNKQHTIKIKTVDETILVVANQIDEPGKNDSHYTLLKDDEVVGRFRKEDVSGWWLVEEY